MAKEEQKYGPAVDIENINIKDLSPESLLKVYPYKAVRRDAKVNFIEPNATSIVLISQEECLEFDESLITSIGTSEEDGELVPFVNKYFEVLSLTSVGQTQTVITSRSQYKTQYAQIASFSVLTDSYEYTGDTQPMFFTIGSPFDPEAYESGDQRMYIGSNYQPASSGLIEAQMSGQEFSKEVTSKMSEFTLDDISTLEEQVDGAKILFTFNPNLGKNIVVEDTGGTESTGTVGLTLNLENRTWLGNTFIEAKGTREILSETETDDDGNPVVLDSSFGNIDFGTPSSLIPWQSSPQSIDGRLTMNASWFNFTDVMPLYIVDAFSDGKTLEQARTGYVEPFQTQARDTGIITEGDTTLTFDPNYNQIIPISIRHSNTNVDGLEINFITSTASNSTLTGVWDVLDTRDPFASPLSSGTWQFDAITRVIKVIRTSGFALSSLSPFSFDTLLLSLSTGTTLELFNAEDRRLIEDMLIISAGFSDNWSNAPIQASTGLIDPDYRVGHRAIKIQTVSRLESANVVVSGMWADYEKRNPNLREEVSRYKAMRSIVNALSEDINSAFSTMGGGNRYHQMVLPWYLDTSGGIDYRKNLQTVNDPLTGSDVTTYLLSGVTYTDGTVGGVPARVEDKPSDIIFRVKTQYIKDTPISSENSPAIYDGFKTPSLIPLSDIPSVQTDRTSFLPKIPESLSPLDKPTFPADYRGDIEKELGYLWYLLPNIDFYNLYVENPEINRDINTGDTINVTIPDTPYGSVWTDESVRKYIETNYPKFEITSPIDITEKQSNTYSATRTGRVSTSSVYVNDNIWKDWDKILDSGNTGLNGLPTTNASGPDAQARRQWWYYKNDKVSPGFPKLEKQFSGEGVSVAHISLCLLLNIPYPKNISEANSTHPIIPVTESYRDRAFGKGAWEGFKTFWSFGVRQEGIADYTYRLRASSVAPITLRAKENIPGYTFKFEGQEVAYDENNWENLLISQGVLPTQKTRINLVTDQSFTVKDIQELTITTTFTDNFEILPANGPAISIKLPFRDNESVTRHKVIFY